MFDVLGYAVSAASHGIDLSEAAQALSTQELADYAVAHREAATRLGAMKLILAAEWVDQHPGEVCGSLLTERSLPIGGDGTPPVAEGAIDEWSDLVGVSNGSAKLFLGDVLDLRHRLPLTWQKICLGGVEDWQARKIAQACRPLTQDACRQVDRQIEPWIGQLGWTRMERLVVAAVIDADPELAQQLADEARAAMGVWASQANEHNVKSIFIKTDPLTVSWFMATVNLIADQLKADGDSRTADQRRAAAVNLLARPVDAAAFLARHATTTPDDDRTCASANAADRSGETTQPGSQADTPPGDDRTCASANAAGRSGETTQPGSQADTPPGDDRTCASANAAGRSGETTQPSGQPAAPTGGGASDSTGSGPTAGAGTTGPASEGSAQSNDQSASPESAEPHDAGHADDESPATATAEQSSTGPDPTPTSTHPAPADTETADVEPTPDPSADRAPIPWDLDAEPDPDVDEACVAEWKPNGWNTTPPWDGSTADIPLPDEPDDTHCRCGHDTDTPEPHLRLNLNLPATFDKNAARAAKPKIVLHYHLSCDGLRNNGTQALVRPEHADPMRLTELLDVLKQTGCVVKVQPVIDPASTAPADAYQIPQKLRDAVRYRDCADVSPWATSMSRGLDLDHTQPWREGGPPGQTAYENLGPLSRAPHRVKTLGLKHVRQPDPGTFLWRGRHGHLSVVTNRGTINLGRSPFTAALWNLATPPQLPALFPGRYEISTAERVFVKLIGKHFRAARSGPD